MSEINFLGSFPSLFRSDQLDRKVELIHNGGWFPDTDDMDSVVRRSKTTKRAIIVSNIQTFLDEIKKRKKGTISRVNVFSHGRAHLIALKGHFEPLRSFSQLLVFFDDEDNSFSDTSLQKLAISEALKDIRSRFAKHAKMVFYSCRSGLDESAAPAAEFLKKIAQIFQVTVIGTRGQTEYCFDGVNKEEKVILFKFGVVTCTVTNFHDLDQQEDLFVKQNP